MKTCPKCSTTFEGRTKFCSESCKYWFNVCKKENESHLPQVMKRNRGFFSMLIGSKRASGRGQGRRSGGMVKGAMSAMVSVSVEEVVEVNKENIKKHFSGIPGYVPSGLKLGNGEYVRKEDVFEKLGIEP